MRAAVLRIPKGKGEGEVEPALGGTSAAADDGAGTDDAEARDGGTVPFSLSPASISQSSSSSLLKNSYAPPLLISD